MDKYDIIIVGGGLAGLTSALHLASMNFKVLVFEKQQFPHHKVCGEYISNEITPYLDRFGISLVHANAVCIDTLKLTTVNGKSLQIKLPLGGKGISRHALDDLLYRKVLSMNVPFIFDSVINIEFQDHFFTVTTHTERSFTADLVIGAYGKRDNLDKQLERNFMQKKSPWLAVKGHYKINGFPNNLVALHNFNGGYAGMSMTETGAINLCYLTSYESFKREKDIDTFNSKVVAKNPYLASFFADAEPLFEQSLSIAQISFHQKNAIKNHILMCGDTAGLIHPLCGNGMAMAIHSAKIASDLISRYFEHANYTRQQLEKDYQDQWNFAFKHRLRMGRHLQSLLLNNPLSTLAMEIMTKSPRLLQALIKKTHGKPISC